MSVTSIAETTLALTVIIAVRYVVVSWAVYALLWRRPVGRVRIRRLNADAPKAVHIRHELKLSLLSSWIYALPAALAFEAWKHGGTLVYLEVDRYGIGWLFISGLIFLVVQDTYYYWLHRAMHHRLLFRHVHAGHHRSRQPTPFAAFAFDAWEAALSAWLPSALVFVIPIHPAVILALLTLMTAAAVLNHSGWEVLPQRLVRGPIGGWMISATHHNLHHSQYGRNFGLYFRVWDRLMGTDIMPVDEPVKVRAAAL